MAGRFGFFFFFMNKTSSAARAAGLGGSGLEGPALTPPTGGAGPALELVGTGLVRSEGPVGGGRGGGVDVGGGGAPDMGDDDRMAEDEDIGDDSRLIALGGRSLDSLDGLRLTP